MASQHPTHDATPTPDLRHPSALALGTRAPLPGWESAVARQGTARGLGVYLGVTPVGEHIWAPEPGAWEAAEEAAEAWRAAGGPNAQVV